MVNDGQLALRLHGAVTEVSSTAKRQEFREQLANQMRDLWLGDLVNCELGRNQDGAFWVLTIHHPVKGVHAVKVRVGERDPYSSEALAFVLERVTRWAWQAP